MFTGLVEGMAQVSEMTSEGVGIRFIISVADRLAADASVGDSVSVDGCCLTIVDISRTRWAFQAGPETLSKTTLGRLQVQQHVNIERSLPANGRLGGHFVQGHVDGVAVVDSIMALGEWTEMWFSTPRELTDQMVPKGSVAVDGVSLTIVNVLPDRFSVALIPHTLEATTLGLRRSGDVVNIETDILGKYVKKFCGS